MIEKIVSIDSLMTIVINNDLDYTMTCSNKDTSYHYVVIDGVKYRTKDEPNDWKH